MISALAAGCGLKGSLYLPQDTREPIEAPGAAGPVPTQSQEQKKDRTGREDEASPQAPSTAQPDPDRPTPPPQHS